jgi:hypothetical protein
MTPDQARGRLWAQRIIAWIEDPAVIQKIPSLKGASRHHSSRPHRHPRRFRSTLPVAALSGATADGFVLINRSPRLLPAAATWMGAAGQRLAGGSEYFRKSPSPADPFPAREAELPADIASQVG